jgi:hypothetical protein
VNSFGHVLWAGFVFETNAVMDISMEENLAIDGDFTHLESIENVFFALPNRRDAFHTQFYEKISISLLIKS